MSAIHEHIMETISKKFLVNTEKPIFILVNTSISKLYKWLKIPVFGIPVFQSLIIGSYFFEKTGAFGPVIVAVTGRSYEGLLHNHVIPDLQQRGCADGIILMQVGVPSHAANPVKQLLKGHFGNARVISCHFPAAWPPQSPDLNLLASGCGAI
ncbi:uncharacterized protein TNCV_35521 [Trichonephila clavipes]|nr:uncharacterized protein TNCV_35521 [Trichonephila clavipes]